MGGGLRQGLQRRRHRVRAAGMRLQERLASGCGGWLVPGRPRRLLLLSRCGVPASARSCVCALPPHQPRLPPPCSYDEGCVMVKLGREEPVASMDASGKIIWARHNEVQTVNVKSLGDAEEVRWPLWRVLGRCEGLHWSCCCRCALLLLRGCRRWLLAAAPPLPNRPPNAANHALQPVCNPAAADRRRAAAAGGEGPGLK